jgi:hypothetical protein
MSFDVFIFGKQCYFRCLITCINLINSVVLYILYHFSADVFG